MEKIRLNRANPDFRSRSFFSVIDAGLSEVYPARRDGGDAYGWLFEPGYPPSYGAFGRIRAAMTVKTCLAFCSRRTLEVAAGGAGLAAALAKVGTDVVINDLRSEILSESLSHFEFPGERVSHVGGNLFELDPDLYGTFDLVVATEIVEHVAHPDQLLEHLVRFLSPGGRIVVTTPNGKFFRNALPTFREIENPDALESKQFRPDADGHLFLLTPAELGELATGAGLRVESMFVWATPLLTGHVGMRRLAGRWFTPIARAAEAWAQWLPASIRNRVCYSLVATMVKP